MTTTQRTARYHAQQISEASQHTAAYRTIVRLLTDESRKSRPGSIAQSIMNHELERALDSLREFRSELDAAVDAAADDGFTPEEIDAAVHS